jgi:hypothetical protein
MQFAKDSFYMVLRERLAVLNPERTVVRNGATRPAVVVGENEPTTSEMRQANVFYIWWGGARLAPHQAGARRPGMALGCEIRYGTSGTTEGNVDRGRLLAALDEELLGICHPGWAPKRDFTRTPTVDLGTNILWSSPELEEAQSNGRASGAGEEFLEHQAKLTLFFFPEVELS